jgi:predicted DsbA family dithiol-disulfide isomerase
VDPALQPDDHAIVVFSDIACPWAHIAVHRLLAARAKLGLESELAIDHRPFPLELVNGRPTPKQILDAEIPGCMELEPEAGWSLEPSPWTYPVSTLPALEAVQAAKSQGSSLSERLDVTLRRAMFAEWRCLAVFPVVMEVAETVEGLDTEQLWNEIVSGRARADFFHHDRLGRSDAIPGSPTLVLADGSTHHNPGIEMHWDDSPGETLVIDSDDPGVMTELVEQARALRPSD